MDFIMEDGSEIRLSPRIAAALETTRQRATTLLPDGYRIEPINASSGVFFVRRPAPLLDKKTGEITDGYTVDLGDGSCTCKMFEMSGAVRSCKHALACREAVAEAARMLGLTVEVGSGRNVGLSGKTPSNPWGVVEPAPVRSYRFPERGSAAYAAQLERDF
jgi:hypothetical protein